MVHALRGAAAAGIAAMLSWTPPAPVVAASSPEKVYPVSPVDGSVVGPRAVFELAYAGLGDPHPRDLRFRLTLEPVGEGQKPYDFDQKRRRSGWMVGAPGRALFRPPRPLRDGRYRWRGWLWDGVAWIGSRQRYEIRIDSVPPADVEGLRIAVEGEPGKVVLAWDPVTLDRKGRPEFVTRYHVYRYEGRSHFGRIRRDEIGLAQAPRFVDDQPISGVPALQYYKVTAEDEAGNEGGTGH